VTPPPAAETSTIPARFFARLILDDSFARWAKHPSQVELIFGLTRFLHANRYPLRLKTLQTAKKEKAVRAGTERLNFRNCRFATGSAAEFRRGL
jgi:hypothetical protein